jgi:hypothetical protein
MHKNTIIRKKIQELLTVTGSGINVYNYRLRDTPDEKLPAISIYMDTEGAAKTQDQVGYQRDPNVIIVCYAKGKDSTSALPSGEKPVDEKLDDLYQFLEDRLFAEYQTLDKTIFNLYFTGVSGVTAENLGENGIKLIGYTTWTAHYNQQIS